MEGVWGGGEAEVDEGGVGGFEVAVLLQASQSKHQQVVRDSVGVSTDFD
jgi:hypothetical protein